jgi:transposase-like protein
MKTSDFKVWMDSIHLLSTKQRQRLLQTLLPHKAKSLEVIKQLEEGYKPSCPSCHSNRYYRWGTQSGFHRYRCRDCQRTYTILSNTPFSRLRHKEQWLTYSSALIQGLTVRASARRCGVHKNTSFRWRHRFLKYPSLIKASRLQGIVEADETFFPYSCKGQRHLNRPARKRGKAIHRRGTSQDQVPVLVIRDRSGATTDFKLSADQADQIAPCMGPLLAKDAILCTDGSQVFKAVARKLAITHRPVNLAAGIRVIANVYHVQNVNAYDSRLKQWMARFHGVATKYLENYLGWRRLLERLNLNITPALVLHEAWGGHKHFQLLTQT